MVQMSSFGCSTPKTGMATSSSTCVASIQPRRRPSIGKPKRSISGDHRNFHVYGSWISANRPIAFRSTPSERSQAGSRLMSRYSGNPDEKPMKTHISIRRLKSASRQDSFGGAGVGVASLVTCRRS